MNTISSCNQKNKVYIGLLGREYAHGKVHVLNPNKINAGGYIRYSAKRATVSTRPRFFTNFLKIHSMVVQER